MVRSEADLEAWLDSLGNDLGRFVKALPPKAKRSHHLTTALRLFGTELLLTAPVLNRNIVVSGRPPYQQPRFESEPWP